MIVTAGPDPAILFVKRRVRPGDPWSGHMAFPGGFMAEAEGSSSATAIRETLEETGLDLARLGEHLGRLDDVYPRTILIPRVVVTPVVFGVPETLAVSEGAEVQEAVWLPASSVFDPHSRRPYEFRLPAGPRVFDSIVVGEYTIWGLTERVLQQILALLSL